MKLSLIFLESQSIGTQVVNVPLGGLKEPDAAKLFLQRIHRWVELGELLSDTVDGRNPAPVDVENVPCFTRFNR